ncbi:hypothetical protein [Streptomyces sp. AcE210]|uniref:hypothetical protein n=1 Tax=Streptomyces sp. AcE210 TaxID=2292703 RepID=UPI00140426D1|nr:hypothetical protein [Streptomyces sp. AcE210]
MPQLWVVLEAAHRDGRPFVSDVVSRLHCLRQEIQRRHHNELILTEAGATLRQRGGDTRTKPSS